MVKLKHLFYYCEVIPWWSYNCVTKTTCTHACHMYVLCFDREMRGGGDDLLWVCSDLIVVCETSHPIPLDSQNKFPDLLMPTYQVTWLQTKNTYSLNHVRTTPCLSPIRHTLKYHKEIKNKTSQLQSLIMCKPQRSLSQSPFLICYLLWKLESVCK